MKPAPKSPKAEEAYPRFEEGIESIASGKVNPNAIRIEALPRPGVACPTAVGPSIPESAHTIIGADIE